MLQLIVQIFFKSKSINHIIMHITELDARAIDGEEAQNNFVPSKSD